MIEVIQGKLYGKLPSFPQDCPEDLKVQVQKNHQTFVAQHRKLSLQLYEKHMSMAQLQALLEFLTSETGMAIRQAQARIEQ